MAKKKREPKVGNPELIRAMLDLRRSSATSRHRSLRDYRRKPKHPKRPED